MKPLLWKEFHENLKWAAIPLLVMFGYMANFGTCLCDQYFLFVSFVGAVFGGALGIVQMTFESHGDRRALLLHRPIDRTRIFLAKVFSGAALYLLALGVPLGYYLATAFIPGHVAPQLPLANRWPLVFPWFADLLTGLVYYFAGALAGLRPGRWFGSRLLGFPAALLATFLVWNAAEFWQALLALLLISSVMALAAWGSFLTAGDTDAQPPLAKFGLAGTFLLGLSLLSAEGKSVFEYRVFRTRNDTNYASHHIDRDGKILIVERIANDALRVFDLAGVERDEFRRMDRQAAEVALMKLSARTIQAHSEKWQSSGRSYRTISRYVVRMSNPLMPPGEGWCYVPSLGELVGYNHLDHTLIGRIGPDGFAPINNSPRARFRGPLDYSPVRVNPDYLVFPDCVRMVDFERRETSVLYAAAGGERVHGAHGWRDGSQSAYQNRDDKTIRGVETYTFSPIDKLSQIVVATNRAIHLLNSAGKQEASLPVTHDTRRYLMQLYQLENPPRFAVHYLPSPSLGLIERESMGSHFVEYSNAGEELSRTELPPLRRMKRLPHQPWFGALTSPAEAAFVLGSVRQAFFNTDLDGLPVRTKFENEILEEYYRILPFPLDLADGLKNPRVRLYAAGVALNALLGAIGCWWVSRRLAIVGVRRMLWIGCGLLFGPVGALLMALVQELPPRFPCPLCHNPRLVTRDLCEHCGVQHASPAVDGTEILNAA